ncbi:MAG: hypothetical protein QM817_01665 [Archangium sp.]
MSLSRRTAAFCFRRSTEFAGIVMKRRLIFGIALIFLACPTRPGNQDAGNSLLDAGSGTDSGSGGGGGSCTGFPPMGPTGGGVFTCAFIPIRSDLHFPHEPYVVGLRAPEPECRPIPLSVSVKVIAPDGSDVPLDQPSTPFADQFGGVVTNVFFTPPDSGTYVVSASFAPSLGEASGSVAITPFFDERGVVISGVTDCVDAPWPLGNTTIACETGSGIVLYAADGGRFELDGVNLVTADDVIWSLRDAGTSQVLQRHVWSGSSLALTDEWSGEFSAERIRGLHTKDTAIRLRTPLAGHHFLMVARTGAPLKEAFIPDDVAVLDAGNIFWSETDVSDSSQLVAFTERPWVVATDGFPGRECGINASVISLRRPGDVGGFLYGFGFANPAIPAPPPTSEFELWPLWLSISSRTVLANGGLSDWPMSRVVRVGSTHVVLSTDGGFLLSPIN